MGPSPESQQVRKTVGPSPESQQVGIEAGEVGMSSVRHCKKEFWGPLNFRFGQRLSKEKVLESQHSWNVQVPLRMRNVLLGFRLLPPHLKLGWENLLADPS